MDVVSFFAGCGGLDLGFRQAGFRIRWANEIDPVVRSTYIRNHPDTEFLIKDIRHISPKEVPDCIGFIGGPPCQAWSVAGMQRGLADERGRVFLTYIEMIKFKLPLFFLIENVKGILSDKFRKVFDAFLISLEKTGYEVEWRLIDAAGYKVPQNRERVFIVGFRKELGLNFRFPAPLCCKPVTLQQAIGDITEPPRKTNDGKIDSVNPGRPNHDVYGGSFGAYYRRGNRRRQWEQPSFTIHATAENIPLHPSSPKMNYYGHEHWNFQQDRLPYYRRMSVRECARLQTFPDNFIFEGDNIKAQYRMIGNAVPPRMAYVLADAIRNSIEDQ